MTAPTTQFTAEEFEAQAKAIAWVVVRDLFGIRHEVKSDGLAAMLHQAAAMAQFANQARQQALQEAFALRSQPLNEIAGLMGGSQIAMPQFQGLNYLPLRLHP